MQTCLLKQNADGTTGRRRRWNCRKNAQTGHTGTYGYLAPELAYTMTLTENCDIYNFRVVALETLMGRHPRELISSSLDDSSNKNIMVKDLLDLRIRLPLSQKKLKL
ncbi:hypothetical protein Ahy_A07g033711 [Arachis hypogaea]|uniref:non-specific serine/threonine protein kinase n=1 Tax=Arachis hypogaea TaxID=3818 RepID=A0A445CA24_ARAHY|nr:hypothetical protein Ahy_A07g033711 [Arachis hypogaea]